MRAVYRTVIGAALCMTLGFTGGSIELSNTNSRLDIAAGTTIDTYLAATPAKIQILENNSGITDRRIFRRWRKFVEQIGHVMLEMMRVRITREKAIPILGRKSERFLTLKPEYLKGDFTVQFGGNVYGQTPAPRQMGYRGIATTYGASGVVDLAELARADLSEIGHADTDRFLTRKDGPEPVSPRHEQASYGNDFAFHDVFDIPRLVVRSRFVGDLQHLSVARSDPRPG